MMNELTKSDVKTGAEFRQSASKKTLSAGTGLKGLQGVLKTRNETKTIDVFSYSKDDRGVLLITVIADGRKETDQALIDKFWETLIQKF